LMNNWLVPLFVLISICFAMLEHIVPSIYSYILGVI
jgi:hypothetical protein